MSLGVAAHPAPRRRHLSRSLFRLASLTSALLAVAACGGDDSSAPPSPTDGGTRDASCEPRLPNPWAPRWHPPRTVLRACTDAQIESMYTLCESDSAYSVACAAFNRDPANAACLRCLYTTEDEDTYGPLVYLRNRTLRVNVEGCLALADGHLDASGCGAQVHGFVACSDAACMTSCAAYDDFVRCSDAAEKSVCLPFRLSSACGDPAAYDPCLDFTTFAEGYRAIAKLFCGAGFPGRGDAGTGDAGPDAAARSIGSQGRSLGAPLPIRHRSVDRLRLWHEIEARPRAGQGIGR
jgi:hypothetical protein